MAVGDAYVFPGFLIPVLTQLFFPKPPTTFLTCFSRGERRKYAGKKVRPNRVSNSRPPGHESDALTTEPSEQGETGEKSQGESKFKILTLPCSKNSCSSSRHNTVFAWLNTSLTDNSPSDGPLD